MAKMAMRCGVFEWSAAGSEEFLSREREAVNVLLQSPTKIVLPSSLEARPTEDCEAGEVMCRWWREQPLSLSALKQAVDAGLGPQSISPFDEITVKLIDGRSAVAVCAGFDRDNVHPFFVFKDCIGKGQMNTEATNKTGYYASAGRKYVLEELYPLLPQELKDIITPRTLIETVRGQEVRYSDPLWLPSAMDVFGPRTPDARWWPDEPDSFQLPIFQRERDRVKEYIDDPDYGTCGWWLRSPGASSADSFCFVYTNGGAATAAANYSYGFAPGFCV